MTERTHCIHGHPWVPENLYLYPRRAPYRPKAMCKTCTKAAAIRTNTKRRARERAARQASRESGK